MVTSHTWQEGEGKCQRAHGPKPSPGSAGQAAHLKPSQVEGIGHLPVSVTAFFSKDGNAGGGATWGEECPCARGLLPHPSAPDTLSRAGPASKPWAPPRSAQAAKPLHTFPHQAHEARKLWERWGAGSRWAPSAPAALLLPGPHSGALPAADPAGNWSPPRGLVAAQRAPPERQPRSLIPGPRDRGRSFRG